MEEKLTQVKFYMYEQFEKFSPVNVASVSEPNILAEDLSNDKIHLNEAGQKKFYEKILEDLKIGKEELAKFDEEGEEWDDLERLSQKTPKTSKKRPAPDEEVQTNTKKRKEEESVKEMLKSFMMEIREDRKVTSKKTEEMVEAIDKLKEAEIEIRQEITSLKQEKEEDHSFTASLREDIDAIENESLRHTVIVKKLKTEEILVNDRAELTRKIQTIAIEMAAEVLGKESTVAYIALLYTGREGIRLSEGQYPPFRMIFKTKEDGITFKEKAVQRSKNAEDKLHKAYFINQQSQATRVRTMLMWSAVDKIKDPLKNIDAWVNQALNKPTLQVKGEERNQRSYSFAEAMSKYGERIDEKAKTDALKLARRFFAGSVQKMFIVIKD